MAGDAINAGIRRKKVWSSAILRTILLVGLVPVLLLLSLWTGLAFWFRLPLAEAMRAVSGGAYFAFGLCVAIALFTHLRRTALVLFGVSFAAVLFWWSTIQPPKNADWAADYSRQFTGNVEDNILNISNVRNFDWKTETEFTERWETRQYDLSELATVDLFLSQWGSSNIAHFMISFGFKEGEYLVMSVEVRRRKNSGYSPVAAFFKNDPIVIIASDERDVIGVRSNVRGEDVQIFPLKAEQANARKVLLRYVLDANHLEETPMFYNSLTTNCTTAVVKILRAVGAPLPMDWRLALNGYLPEFLYERGKIVTTLPLEEVRAIAHIEDRAEGDPIGFSRRIREGVPVPR